MRLRLRIFPTQRHRPLTGVSLGHWESYLATSDEVWKGLSQDERKHWDRIARDVAMKNAEAIEKQDKEVRDASEKAGGKFVPVADLPEDMRAHIAKAATNTWIQWIEQTEKKGHPGKATARLWAQLVQAEGGKLPDGVADYLAR